MKKALLHLALLTLVLAACAPQPAGVATQPPGTAQSTQPGSSLSETPQPAPVKESPEASPPETSQSPLDIPVGARRNLFSAILDEVPLPQGWEALPCEGQAPVLCTRFNGQDAGGYELMLFELSNYPSLVGFLQEAGIPAESASILHPSQAEGVTAALLDQANQDLLSFAADRQGWYRQDGISFSPIQPTAVRFGPLPGVFFGFAGIGQKGNTVERSLTYLATDGELVYVIGAVYPNEMAPGASDEALMAFQPALQAILARLKLPLSALETSVRKIQTIGSAPYFSSMAGGAPAGQIPSGTELVVTGVSPEGALWRVACPGEAGRQCWVPNEQGLVSIVETGSGSILVETPVAFEAKNAQHAGVSFSFDASLGELVEGQNMPALIEPTGFDVINVPQHIQFDFINPYTFNVPFSALQPGLAPWYFHQRQHPQELRPQVFVFPVDEYIQINPHVLEQINNLRAMLLGEELPAQPNGSPAFLPVLPVFTQTQDVSAAVKPVEFENGRGIHFLARYSQEAAPVRNPDLFYTFQGLTEDKQFYVAAFFPLYAPHLEEQAEISDWDSFYQGFAGYMADTIRALDDLPSTAFTPDLAVLDDLVRSLVVTPEL